MKKVARDGRSTYNEGGSARENPYLTDGPQLIPDANGDVACTCGRHIGHVTTTGLTTKCPGCKQWVNISIQLYKLRIIELALQTLAAV